VKVLFLKDNISGKKGDIKYVSDGFATNHLIPKGIAVIATNEILDKIKKEKEAEEKMYKIALEKAKQMEETKVVLFRKATPKGTINGSVSKIDIAKSLQKEGFSVEPKRVEFHSVRVFGTYIAKIFIDKGVKAKIEVQILSV